MDVAFSIAIWDLASVELQGRGTRLTVENANGVYRRWCGPPVYVGSRCGEHVFTHAWLGSL